MSIKNPRLRLEVLRISRFGIVGAAATATHILIVALLISVTSLPTLIANTLAFISAFGISLAGHYFWTFQKPGSPRRATGRFMLVSLSAFIANMLVLASALDAGWFSPLVTSIVAAAVIPLTTYLASRFWAFQACDA